MAIYTTHYYFNGLRWSGDRIKAISWDDAEYQAASKGLMITGRLIVEIPCDGNTIRWRDAIDYEKIANN